MKIDDQLWVQTGGERRSRIAVVANQAAHMPQHHMIIHQGIHDYFIVTKDVPFRFRLQLLHKIGYE